MIQYKLKREIYGDTFTIGKLYRNDEFICDTLEDKVRDSKIPKVTAIPFGNYQVIFNWSNKFQKYMPLLLNVPNYEGIRIHAGNYDTDTEGCILVGIYNPKFKKMITTSRITFKKVFSLLQKDTKQDKVYIEIV